MNKILVTGGAGFIGSHLVKKLLSEGNHVIVADILLRGNKIEPDILNNIEFHKADVRNKETMLKLGKGCKLIYHFAAVLGVDVVADNPVETMDTEVIGMQNVVESALTNGVEKIIYASTSGIYGHSAIERSVTEEIHVDPRTSYAMAKRYNEIYLASNYEEKGLNSISVRFFNVYGENQDNRMVIPRFYEQALNNEPITVFGTGNQTRDFTFIDDAVFACTELAAKVNGSEIFNIAYGEETTIKDLAETIVKITGSKSKIHFIEAPKKRYDYEVERRFGNCDKLFEAIGFRPETPLDAGLKKTFKKSLS